MYVQGATLSGIAVIFSAAKPRSISRPRRSVEFRPETGGRGEGDGEHKPATGNGERRRKEPGRGWAEKGAGSLRRRAMVSLIKSRVVNDAAKWQVSISS